MNENELLAHISGLEDVIEKSDEKINFLKQQVRNLRSHKRVHVKELYDEVYRCGVVSDVHMGSLYHSQGLLELAYDAFVEEGIKDVYVPGDLCAGEKMYRGQEYELYVHGAHGQAELTIDQFPRRDGITTHYILGNHDWSFWKRSGVDIGKIISPKRPDMKYLGVDEADVKLNFGDRHARLRLCHPGKGSAYALSYQPQKYIEALSGGEKPNIVLMGHYHKAECIPNYRNVYLIQAGCIEAQTPFMRSRNLAAHMGFWILEFNINQPAQVSRFKSEFIAWYGEGSKW